MSEAMFHRAYELLEEFCDRHEVIYEDGDIIDIAINATLYRDIINFVQEYK